MLSLFLASQNNEYISKRRINYVKVILIKQRRCPMEKHIEVMRKSVELSETVQEGLQHIQKLLTEGQGEQTVFLFEDILSAYATITRTIEPALRELKNENIPAIQFECSKAADLVVIAYEAKEYAKVQEALQFNLVPKFKKLNQELESAFRPFLVS